MVGMTEVKQKHLGTGHSAVIVRVENFASPIFIDAGRYVLVVASEKTPVDLSVKTARAWIDAGALYICAWGPDCEEVHESFDYASFLPEYGGELPFTLLTTAHHDEPLDEALWFAFYCAKDADFEPEWSVVVIVVDSESLETRCRDWLETNRE
jgi:hypothetical protein